MSQWSSLLERVAWKWQIPLFVLSLFLLVGAFLRIQPNRESYSLDETCDYLDQLIGGGATDQAIAWGEAFLLQEERTDGERAAIHLRLARARSIEAEVNGIHTTRAGARIIEHYEQADRYGLALNPDDLINMGQASEWQGKLPVALEHYESGIARGVQPRSDLRKHVYTLKDRLASPAQELNETLDTLLAELEDHRLDIRLWVIERKLDVLEALDRSEEVSTLLVRNAERFRESDFADAFAFLETLLLYGQGHYDEAEAHLRAIRNRVEPDDEVYAKTGWLLGRVVMNDDGPQRPLEAISFFRDVLDHHPEGPYAVASYIGRAEALAMLDRHAEAVEAYRIAVDELESVRDRRLIDRDVLRMSLGVMSQTQRASGDLRSALEYVRLAISLADPGNLEQVTALLQQVGQVEELLAERLHAQAVEARGVNDAEAGRLLDESRELYADATLTYIELAKLNTPNERLSADANWRAAALCAKSDQLDRAAELYRTFISEWHQHSLVPRALLRIGQLHQAMGQLPEAVDAYRECYREFPRTIDGSRALIPLAYCYLAMGPENDELAEKTLRIILDDSEVFTPEAPEFADALFMLGDVLNRQGEFERAIATLEETLDRYPDDPRGLRARSLLADSYRQSGLALKREIAEAASAAEIERMRVESVTRFNKARELYHDVISAYELRSPQGLDRLEAMYLRHAYLYEADCAFEVGDYRSALKLYEETAGNYKDVPSGLAAYVQVINCHIFLGQPAEARAALARALILVDAIPREAFDASVSPEAREDWNRYFEWLGESKLF